MYKHIFMADWKKRSAKPVVRVTGMVVLKWPETSMSDLKSASESNKKLKECLLSSKRSSENPLKDEEEKMLSGLYTRYKMTDHGGLTDGLMVVHFHRELSADKIETWLQSLSPASRKNIIDNNQLL